MPEPLDVPVEAAGGLAGAGRFCGRAQWRGSLLLMFELAIKQGWTEMVFCDPDFSDWPLGERASIALLNRWAGQGRRLIMLADRYDQVINHQPRFVDWRKTWDHIVVGRQTRGGQPGATPSALWGGTAMLQRHDLIGSCGICSSDPHLRLRLRQRLDELLAQARPAFPATKLGL